MSRRSITELYERAIRHGRAKGLDFESEDFAGWCVERWLRGKGQHQTFDQAFIDYRRGVHGNSRSSIGRKKQSAEHHYYTITPAEDDEIGQRTLRSAERALADMSREPARDRRIDDDPAAHITGRAQTMWDLVHSDEWTMKEVGDIYGITESAVCLILKRSNIKIAKALQLADMRERVENGETEMRIEWITL
jgi:hypothetical protein